MGRSVFSGPIPTSFLLGPAMDRGVFGGPVPASIPPAHHRTTCRDRERGIEVITSWDCESGGIDQWISG